MKIKVTNDVKKIITLADAPIINEIRKCFAEDSFDNYTSTALSLAGVQFISNAEVYKTTAEIAKNCRVWNVYGDEDEINTADYDVWIEIKAFVKFDGFYIIGAYVSDLWSRSCDYSNDDEIRSHMYIEKYTKV